MIDKLEIVLSEGPSDFENIESDVHELDVWELQKYVQKVGRLGIEASEFKVLFYEKLSTSFICLIFAFLPFSGVFYPSRRSSTMGRNIILLLVFTFAFWFMYSSSLTMGSNGKILPFFAAFGIPMFCLAYVAIVIFKHRNLTD
jgi:lipopolysaccharide export LptBFGC system permease protein LptF